MSATSHPKGKSDAIRQFASNLLHSRIAAGLTQEELATRAGLHRTEVSLLERAAREPRLSTAIRVAVVLDISVASLCHGIDWDEERWRYRVVAAKK
jgi:transcriptional regulator with XRE-family HTH domain